MTKRDLASVAHAFDGCKHRRHLARSTDVRGRGNDVRERSDLATESKRHFETQ